MVTTSASDKPLAVTGEVMATTPVSRPSKEVTSLQNSSLSGISSPERFVLAHRL